MALTLLSSLVFNCRFWLMPQAKYTLQRNTSEIPDNMYRLVTQAMGKA
jgi:hypothetical protein